MLKYRLLICLLLSGTCFLISMVGCSKEGAKSREPLLPSTLETLTPPTLERESGSVEMTSIEVLAGGDLLLTFPDKTSRHYHLTKDSSTHRVIDVIVKDQNQNQLDALPSSVKGGAIYFYPQTPTDHSAGQLTQPLLGDNCIRLFGQVYCPVSQVSPQGN
jgi:hypothetical protein